MSSLITSDYALVRLRESVRLPGRMMCKYGQYGTLRALPLALALRLVEAKQAKMPAGEHLCWLRHAVESQPESA